MQKSILLYLSKLEGFKTAIKNCHWAAKSMNAHEFMDSLEDIVSDHQDLVAEIVQGAYNTKIKINDFKPRPYRISTFTKLVSDIYNAADKFYATIQGNKRFIGLRSVMEDFMGKMQQQIYLNAMCTENKKEVKKLIKENMAKKIIRITENELHNVIAESVNRILMEMNPETFYDAGYKSKGLAGNPDLTSAERIFHQKRSDDFLNYGDDTLSRLTDVPSEKIKNARERGWNYFSGDWDYQGQDDVNQKLGRAVKNLGLKNRRPAPKPMPQPEPAPEAPKKRGLRSLFGK